ncbi:hypothetical protein LCGC14_2761980, partial [marine sediment metagenome]
MVRAVGADSPVVAARLASAGAVGWGVADTGLRVDGC